MQAKSFIFSGLRSLLRILPAALLFLNAAAEAQEAGETPLFTRIEKASGKALSETAFQLRDKLDLTSDRRTANALSEAFANRLLKAEAAGKFVNEHFTNQIVVPVFFNCLDDPLDEQELVAFLEQAMSVKMAGPVYITPPDGALPLPDQQPTAVQLNKALIQCIELRADAIVLFMGLPERQKEREQLEFLKWNENAPRLVLTELTDSFFLSRSMLPCPVAAAILPRVIPLEPEKRPWYDFLLFWKDSPPEPDPFDLRFILLSDENADDLIAEETVFLKPGKKRNARAAASARPTEAGMNSREEANVEPAGPAPLIFPENFTQAYRELFRYDRPSAIDSFERISREMKK